MQFGLKLGSKNTGYTDDILLLYQKEYFQYIELFVIPESFNDTIAYWKQFSIPIIIHAPHSFAGMNLSLTEEADNNKRKLEETFRFANGLKAEYIIFHSGVDGIIDETIYQLHPFIDKRCLIENKPMKGLNGERCLGSTPDEFEYILSELQAGFCLDFGHAICAANTLKRDSLELIQEFMTFKPKVYHLTDGDYTSEYDSHLHYGKGSFPLKDLLLMVPNDAKITNEAKHDSDCQLADFEEDSLFLMTNIYLREAKYDDINLLYEWVNDPDTRLNSFNSATIPYDTHKEWFMKQLNSNETLFFIYHCGEINIGQIRLVIHNNTAIINYSINPVYRGKGFGYKMLLLTENKIIKEHQTITEFIARVKNKNTASLRIFSKLGYVETHDSGQRKFVKRIQCNNV